MKKRLLFFMFVLFSRAFAQDKITDFENISITSPIRVEFVDTLNNKLFFISFRPEIVNGSFFSVTDGKPENTYTLHDSLGLAPTYRGYKLKKYGYLYLKEGHVWRTNGLKLERVIEGSDSLQTILAFNNKLLVYFQKNEPLGVRRSYFAWLDSLNHLSVWEKDIITYQITDSTLHYIKHNTETNSYELHRLTKNNVSVINVIATKEIINNRLEYFSSNTIDYYFLETNTGKKFFSKPKTDTTAIKIIDWGTYFVFPSVIKDDLDHTYLLKYDNFILKAFSTANNGELSEKWSVSVKSISPNNEDIYGYGVRFREMSIIDHTLVFNSTTGGEGINGYYLNVFDLKKSNNRKSSNLINHFRFNFDYLKVTCIDTNTYILDDCVGKKFTYNFLKDSIIQVTTYPFQHPYKPDSIFTVNNQKVLLAENIYNISHSVITALLPTRQIYNINYGAYFIYKILDNKLLFWKVNPVTMQYEVWVNNGEAKGNELLITLDNYSAASFEKGIISFKGKIYFYCHKTANEVSIYETDGTKHGTKKILQSNENYSIVVNIQTNQRQIVFKLFNERGLKRAIVIDEGKVSEIDLTPKLEYGYDIFMTSTDIYIATKSDINSSSYKALFRYDANSLKLIDEHVSRVKVYNHKLFYFKKAFLTEFNSYRLHFTDSSDKINAVINEGTQDYNIYGNKLVSTQFVKANAPMKYIIINLFTNRVDIAIDNFLTYTIESLANALILHGNKKILIVNGRQVNELSITSLNTYRLSPFNNGFLIQEGKSNTLTHLSYYDLSNDSVTRILINRNYNYPIFDKNAGYFLVPIFTTNNFYTWSYWTIKDRKLIDLPNSGNFPTVDSTKAFSFKPNESGSYIWHFDGSRLEQAYQIPIAHNLIKLESNYYCTLYSDDKGYELFKLGLDSLVSYPEIVKGSEGIILGQLFTFNQHLYVYAFTYTDGWQVWKMNNKEEMILSNETSDKGPIIYPNPVRDFVTIQTSQAYQYRIVNIRGQQLMQGQVIPNQILNLEKLPEGLYIIQLYDEQRSYFKKIVKY